MAYRKIIIVHLFVTDRGNFSVSMVMAKSRVGKDEDKRKSKVIWEWEYSHKWSLVLHKRKAPS